MQNLDSSIALIFGGCCCNVFTLESILQHEPESGLIITFFQFVIGSIYALPSQISTRSPRYEFTKPSIPLHRLIIISVLFFAINMLNNWAFAFDISVPLHIILRSFGSVTTLAMGWMWGKKYSIVQIFSVIALTVGVIISAWADASAKGTSMDLIGGSVFGNGLLVLFAAQILSAYMGIYVEQTYSLCGRHWKEVLFYTHICGLVFSLGLYPSLKDQLSRLWVAPPSPFTVWLRSTFPGLSEVQNLELWAPSRAILTLMLNSLTQVICISGVNKLGSQTSAVTVTVVLNVRKLVSFLLSCWLFGNPVGGLMSIGASIVFGSGALYGWDSAITKSRTTKIADRVVKQQNKSTGEDSLQTRKMK